MNVMEMFYEQVEEEQKEFFEESIMYNLIEDLLVIMEDKKIKRKDLAKMIDKSPSLITQIFNESRGLTFKTFIDICYALKVTPEIKFI